MREHHHLPAVLLAEAGFEPGGLAATAARLGEHEPALAALAAAAQAVKPTRKDVRLVDLLPRSGDKSVIYPRFVKSPEHVMRVLAGAGIAAAEFRRGVGTAAKDAAVLAFRDGLPVLVSTDVGAEGLNLQFASTLINYDLPWNPMRIEQRIGRLHRIGQKQEVKVWNLASRGTAEDRLLDVLDRRLNLFGLVVGEMDMVLGTMADERDFEHIGAAIYREAAGEAEIATGFDRIEQALSQARTRLSRVKAFDEALLGEDYEL